jgi:hypothetical protein
MGDVLGRCARWFTPAGGAHGKALRCGVIAAFINVRLAATPPVRSRARTDPFRARRIAVESLSWRGFTPSPRVAATLPRGTRDGPATFICFSEVRLVQMDMAPSILQRRDRADVEARDRGDSRAASRQSIREEIRVVRLRSRGSRLESVESRWAPWIDQTRGSSASLP